MGVKDYPNALLFEVLVVSITELPITRFTIGQVLPNERFYSAEERQLKTRESDCQWHCSRMLH